MPATSAGGKPAPPARNLPTYRVPNPGGIACHLSTPDLRRDGRHLKEGLPPLDTRRPGPRGRLPRRRFKPRPAGCSPSRAYNGPDRSKDGGTHGYSRWVQPSTWSGRALRAASFRAQPLLRGCNPSKDPPRAVAQPSTGRKACPPGAGPQQFPHAIGGHGAGFRAPTCRVRPFKFRRFSPNQPGIGASNLVQPGAAPRP